MMQKKHNKKPSLYFGEPDAEILDTLSKAALLDIAVESLRLRAGSCDSPVDRSTLAEMINPTLAARGDREIRI